jgi:hypothetical protein
MVCAIVLVLCLPAAVSARDVAASSSESLGFFAERLSYIRSWLTTRRGETPIDASMLRKMVRVPGAELQVRVADGEPVKASGAWPILDFDRGRPVAASTPEITRGSHLLSSQPGSLGINPDFEPMSGWFPALFDALFPPERHKAVKTAVLRSRMTALHARPAFHLRDRYCRKTGKRAGVGQPANRTRDRSALLCLLFRR